MSNVVVLNFDYGYLNIVNLRKALAYIIKKKAEPVKFCEDEEICNFERTFVMKKPLVVRLLEMVEGVYKKKVPFCYPNVFKRDRYTCQYCKATRQLTIDHVIPVSKGGKSTFENCVTACSSCNNKKGNKFLYETDMRLIRQPYTPSLIQFMELKLKKEGISELLSDLWG